MAIKDTTKRSSTMTMKKYTHIFFYNQNIALKYATSNIKKSKNKKKFLINLESMP